MLERSTYQPPLDGRSISRSDFPSPSESTAVVGRRDPTVIVAVSESAWPARFDTRTHTLNVVDPIELMVGPKLEPGCVVSPLAPTYHWYSTVRCRSRRPSR